ncbi:MAG: YggS family pyridoxal phosphate-dependent enzyme [Anaerolineales bacterium]
MASYSQIRAHVAEVQERLAAACARSGRPREAVTLVAVTKMRSLDEVRAAYACGLRDLGENRSEDLLARRRALDDEWAVDPPRWHMIGHIQSRKAADVVAGADVVHSLDSFRLAERLDRLAGQAGRVLPVLVELNVSGEVTKNGLLAWTDELLAETLAVMGRLATLRYLSVLGLMTMAPNVTDPELARSVFVRLRMVQALARERLPFASWGELSMGMTNDYEVAVEEGATMVRIGRAIFGEYGEERTEQI